MKVYVAELLDTMSMTRVQWTDDVALVVYCGDGLKAFDTIAENFNKSDERTTGGAPVRIDTKDNWEIKEIGDYTGHYNEPSIITYMTADA